jgi:hypothetical protein
MCEFSNLARRAIAVAGCAVAFGAGADEQTFYKSVLPNGRIVYGDAPAAAAKRTEKITVRTDTPTPEAAAEAKHALEINRRQLLRDGAARNARLTQLETDIAATYNELKTAETGRETGRGIQEGDRQGRRLLPQYSERQRTLEGAVRQARLRLDKLLAERAALR